MSGFLYGVALQWKLDIRSKSLLVTCYIVPLIFFLLMGGIFTSVMPEMRSALIQSMIVMGVSMGAFIGLPPSLVETYGSNIKKVYQANGVPLYLGLITMFLSAFVHLMMACIIILLLAPILFEAALPVHFPEFFSCSCHIYYCIAEYWKHIRADCKKSGETDDDSAACIFTLYHAFRDYVSRSYAAGFS